MIEISDPLGLEEPTRPIPRSVLAMTGGLAVVAVLLTVFSVWTGVGRVASAPADEAVEVLSISFLESTDDGAIRVVSAPDGAVLLTLAEGEGGFMRGILRPLHRERVRHGQPLDAAYRLSRHESGALTLADASTDLVVDIGAFGATSVAHFRRLFTPGEGRP